MTVEEADFWQGFATSSSNSSDVEETGSDSPGKSRNGSVVRETLRSVK